MRRFTAILLLVFLLMSLAMPVSAATGVSQSRLNASVATDGSCIMNLELHFRLEEANKNLTFPVPINARYFKNPRNGFAIVGAAGPVSNFCLAVIHLLLLRLVMLYSTNALTNGTMPQGVWLIVLSLIVYVLYMGVAMNVILAIFNLIPIPPFDGSRIFYAFLPPKWYFGVMKYERYIMLGCIVLFFLMSNMGINPLARFENWVINGLFTVTGMGSGTLELGVFNALLDYLDSLIAVG